MAPTNVALLSCGSFDPITFTHLRMFEVARDHLNKTGDFNVVCGIISPVHDAFSTEPAAHRCAMVQLALESNDWVRMSAWETQQGDWTRTPFTLQHHQDTLNAAIKEYIPDSRRKKRAKLNKVVNDNDWIPEDLESLSGGTVQVKLLCKGDLLISLATPGGWRDEDIATIVGRHGLVVMGMEKFTARNIIGASQMLTDLQHNITIVEGQVDSDGGAIVLRRSLRRGDSGRYLIPDKVTDYIKKEGLYQPYKTMSIILAEQAAAQQAEEAAAQAAAEASAQAAAQACAEAAILAAAHRSEATVNTDDC